MKAIRLYEITCVDKEAGKYLYFAITTDSILAQQEHDKLKELNTEDMVGLFSHKVHATEFNYVHRII